MLDPKDRAISCHIVDVLVLEYFIYKSMGLSTPQFLSITIFKLPVTIQFTSILSPSAPVAATIFYSRSNSDITF